MKKALQMTGLAILVWLSSIMATASGGMAPHSAVPFGQALLDAERLASVNPEWAVLQVAGASMEPYFGNNSILITGPVDYDAVVTGMMIVFVDNSGDLVAHEVIEVMADGIRTMGNRNFRADPQLVTVQNLVGSVMAVIHTKGAPDGQVYAGTGQPLDRVYGKTVR